MIKRPDDLTVLSIDLSFNQRRFYEIEIDLIHINRNGRSTFSADDIKAIVVLNLSERFIVPLSSTNFGVESCEYFIMVVHIANKKYKLIFCICSDRPSTIGIVTFHRL